MRKTTSFKDKFNSYRLNKLQSEPKTHPCETANKIDQNFK